MAIETLDDLMELYRKRFNAENAEGIDATVQFHITGEGGGDYVMVIKDQDMAISKGTAEQASMTVTSTFQDWMDMNLGKTNPMVSIMSGKVEIKGSVPLAMKFQSLFFSKD